MVDQICFDGGYVVDRTTGEYIRLGPGDRLLVITEDEQRRREAHAEEENHRVEDEGKIDPTYKKHGAFTWCIFDSQKELLPGVSHTSLSRLMSLATYMGYDNVLENDDGRTMKKADMMDALSLSTRNWYLFVNELQDADVLRRNGKGFMLNERYFLRGHIKIDKKRILANNNIVIKRLYKNGIRSLFEGASPGDVRKMNYLFRLMPYANQSFNVICHNPNQTRLESVNPMSFADMAGVLGCGRSHAKQLRDALLSLSLTVEKHGMPVAQKAVACVPDVNGDGVDRVFINPDLYYGGRDRAAVDVSVRF